MKTSVESHRDGAAVISRTLVKEIRTAIENVEADIEKGAAPTIRKQILAALTRKGWSGKVKISPHSAISITSAKNKIGLCLQTGNMSRMYADLVKLQKLYADGGIVAAVLIVPSLDAAKVLGGNLTNSNRLCNELTIFSSVISCPILIISLD